MYFRFIDDVTFGRKGRDAGTGWQHSATAINYVRGGAQSDVYECLLGCLTYTSAADLPYVLPPIFSFFLLLLSFAV